MVALHLLVNASDFDRQFEARMAVVLRALDTLLTVMRPATWGFRLFDGRARVGRSPRELMGCKGASFGPRRDEAAVCSLAHHVRDMLRSLHRHAPAPLAGGDVSSHSILMRALMEVLGQVRSASEVIELGDDARTDAAALIVVVAASPPNESALAQFVFSGKPGVDASSRDPVAALDTLAESWQRLARGANAGGADVAAKTGPRVLWLDVLGDESGEKGIADRLASALRGDGATALVPACTLSCAAHLLSTDGLANVAGLAQAPAPPAARLRLGSAPSITIEAPDSAAALCVAEPLELSCDGEYTHAWLLGFAPFAALPGAWLAPRDIHLARAPRGSSDGRAFAALSTGLVRQREAALVSLGHHASSLSTGERPGTERRPEMTFGVLIAIDAATAIMYTHRIEVTHAENETRAAAWQALHAAVPQLRAASVVAVDSEADTRVSLHAWLRYEAALHDATYGSASSAFIACSYTADEQRPHSMFDYWLSLVLAKDCDTDAGDTERTRDDDAPVQLDAHACALLRANGLSEGDAAGADCNAVVSREMLRSLKQERRARMPIPACAPVHQSVVDMSDGAPEGETAATASADTTNTEAAEAFAQPETSNSTLDDCEAIQQLVASVNASIGETARAGEATACTATCTELSRLYNVSVETGVPSPLALACCVMPRVCDHSAGLADEGDADRTGKLRGILIAVRKGLLRLRAELRDRHALQASECLVGRKRREYSLQVLLRLQVAALLRASDVTSASDPLPQKQMEAITELLETLFLVLDAPAPAAVPSVTAACETAATHSEGREASSSCAFLEHALAARFLSTLPNTVEAIYAKFERDVPSLIVADAKVTDEAASNDHEKPTGADETDGMPGDRTQRVGSQRGKRLQSKCGSGALPAPRMAEDAPQPKRPCTESSSTRPRPRAGLARTSSVPAPNARHVAALGTMQRARNQNVVVNKSATVAQQDIACRMAESRSTSAKIQARPHDSSPLRRSPRRLGGQGTVPVARTDLDARRLPGRSALATRTVSAPLMPCMSSPGADWRGNAVGRAGAQRLVRSQSGATSQQAPKRTVVGETPSKAAR